jgi:hypothetical protein
MNTNTVLTAAPCQDICTLAWVWKYDATDQDALFDANLRRMATTIFKVE